MKIALTSSLLCLIATAILPQKEIGKREIELFSKEKINLYAEPAHSSKIISELSNLTKVEISCGLGENYCTAVGNRFIQVNVHSKIGFVDTDIVTAIFKREISPKGKFNYYVVHSILGSSIEYRKEYELLVYDDSKQLKFSEKYTSIDSVSWHDDSNVLIKMSSGDAGIATATSLLINAHKGESTVVLSYLGYSIGGGPGTECKEEAHCFCSYATYATREKKYYFETQAGLTGYLLKSPDFDVTFKQGAPTTCMRPNYSNLTSIFQRKKVKKIEVTNFHPKGIVLRFNNKLYLLEYDTDKLTPLP